MARTRDQPILLSIGYSACHWCHVMAHESFENDEIAALMNRHFVNIKVDREERPDLDTIYMRALGLLGEQGGWPLTMFLTPNGEPFWGGTYFPPESRYGRPGFPDVLTTIARIWTTERHKVDSNKAALVKALGSLSSPKAGVALTVPKIDEAAGQLLRIFDPVHGGIKGAPKFPQSPILDLLWRRAVATGQEGLRDNVLHTLDRLCQGGIYDHLGGGFARYSVDERWLVPHFEKMLYDNAQLLGLLANAFAFAQRPLFKTRAIETVDWLRRDMMVGDGFAAALDADSEGEEGKFYIWDEAEIDQVLGLKGTNFKNVFDVTTTGNWEGKTILNRLAPDGDHPNQHEKVLRPMIERLLAVRNKRVPPSRDDKLLADWNGMMIANLAKASAVFDQPDWLHLGERAFHFVLDQLQEGERLAHSWRDGKRLDLGFLEDYAAMADAALALFKTTGKEDYLTKAKGWVDTLDRHYLDQAHGGYFQTANDAPGILLRPKTAQDGPYPSGNGHMVTVLARLFHLTGNTTFRDRADATIGSFAGETAESPIAYATLLSGLAMLEQPVQIVIAGDPGDPRLDDLKSQVLRAGIPGSTIQLVGEGSNLHAGHPAFGKGTVDGKPAVYICEGATCLPPITRSDELASSLNVKRKFS